MTLSEQAEQKGADATNDSRAFFLEENLIVFILNYLLSINFLLCNKMDQQKFVKSQI